MGHQAQFEDPMTFLIPAAAMLGAALLAYWVSNMPRDVYVHKNTLRGIRDRAEAEEARIARDRRVFELSRDLVDRLAQDTTCHHDGDWWLGDRCRDCAIIMVKDTLHQFRSEVETVGGNRG